MATSPLGRIRIVLVAPKNPGNVGAAARAVKNMGLGGLAVIEPRPSRWDLDAREAARKLGAGAGDILVRLRVHPTLESAVRPATYLVATTARGDRRGGAATPRLAASRLVTLAHTRPLAILFGAEDRGLPNRLLHRASEVLVIPAAPAHPSLNLAQAVMIVAYELRLAAAPGGPARAAAPPAIADLDALTREALEALALLDFLRTHDRGRVTGELEAFLARAQPDAREVRMLRGICRQVRWLAARAGRG